MSEPVVLVVDDDRANLESVSRIFQKEGVSTLTAPSPARPRRGGQGMRASGRAAARALAIGLLVGLIACRAPLHQTRPRAVLTRLTVRAAASTGEHVELTEAEVASALGREGRLIVPSTSPLETARHLMGSGRSVSSPSRGPDELTRQYGAWCEHARRGPWDCLSLLDGKLSLDLDGRASLALEFAFETVWEETMLALRHTVNPDAVRTMILTSMATYLLLWLLPEPVSKGIAAVLTAALIAYLGVGTVWTMIQGWRALAREAAAATSLDQIREAGKRFGKTIGQNSARIFVMLACAATASTLGAALESGTLPGAAQAARIAAGEGGFRLAAASQVRTVAIAAEGELTLAVAPIAVAMAPEPEPKSGSGPQRAAEPTRGTRTSPLTRAEARGLARRLGFNEVKDPPFNAHGQPVFKQGNRFITPDRDIHRSGTWKLFDQKGTRLGTYNDDLSVRIGD